MINNFVQYFSYILLREIYFMMFTSNVIGHLKSFYKMYVGINTLQMYKCAVG